MLFRSTEDNLVLFGDFRENPEKYPLSTPSGKIEIFSETIESFGYDDCAGHPRWYEPDEWLGGPRASQFPLHLIANQPKTRLHSQLDHGAASQASKIQGREPIRMHPDAAAARGVSAGDVVRVFNDRASLHATARVSDAGSRVRPGFVIVPFGWVGERTDDGNTVNMLTSDTATDWGGGVAFYDTLVEVARA